MDLNGKHFVDFNENDWRELRKRADARRAAPRPPRPLKPNVSHDAQLVALLRRERLLQPEGAYTGLIWHPSAREASGLEHIAAPTGARRHALKDAARTLKHVQHLAAAEPAFFQEILAAALRVSISSKYPQLRDLQAQVAALH